MTDIAKIPAPAIIIQGDQDRLVDIASARWLAELRPDWALEVFEDVGHVPMLEAHEKFLDVVGAFLTERSAVRSA